MAAVTICDVMVILMGWQWMRWNDDPCLLFLRQTGQRMKSLRSVYRRGDFVRLHCYVNMIVADLSFRIIEQCVREFGVASAPVAGNLRAKANASPVFATKGEKHGEGTGTLSFDLWTHRNHGLCRG
jgi:hypothetical protein